MHLSKRSYYTLCRSVVASAALGACRGKDQTPARALLTPDSAQLVQLAVTELRHVSHDTLPIGVSRFLRSGDSVIIDLAPVQRPGQVILGGGGRFILRRGAIVAAQLYQ